MAGSREGLLAGQVLRDPGRPMRRRKPCALSARREPSNGGGGQCDSRRDDDSA